jgi:Cyclic nucleotide-binding domain
MDMLHSMMPNLIHLGAWFYLVCFLFRNQLLLRGFAILGDLAYTGYYWAATSAPLYEAMIYSTLNMIINITMIMLIFNDKRQSNLSDDELKLYQGLKGISPGDFRKLMRLGTWSKTSETITLTTEGEPVNQLHYILDGALEITKSGRAIDVLPGIFIGEIAFLRNTPASATVLAKTGTTYISWPHGVLHKITAQHSGLHQSLTNLLSSDLAAKVARS